VIVRKLRKLSFLFTLVFAGAALASAQPSGLRTGLTPEQHAAKLRQKLKGRGFTVLVERPFVVVGDEPRASVAEWSAQVVRATVQRLKKEYFAKDPAAILEIWLLKDEASYRKHAKEFFDDEPDTPYGYYLPAKRALIMNIATGGGTLVHEIVHPYIEANFPEAPAWFNEGLGSLYEQSGTRDGRIYGYTNWRLAGLQRGLEKGTVPTFKSLTAMTRSEFYREANGTNYAQARYLCYYLQEKGLLRDFYREFSTNVATDPTGFKSLQKILGEEDMTAFQAKWERFVKELRYP
jgi:hypothetical protein